MECHSNHFSNLNTLSVGPLEVFIEFSHQYFDLLFALTHSFALLSFLKVSFLLFLTDLVDCLNIILFSKRVSWLFITFYRFLLFTLFRNLTYDTSLFLRLIIDLLGLWNDWLRLVIYKLLSRCGLSDRKTLNTKLRIAYRNIRIVSVVLIISSSKKISGVHKWIRICLIIVFRIQCFILLVM